MPIIMQIYLLIEDEWHRLKDYIVGVEWFV